MCVGGILYLRHEKQTKNPAETTGNRYKNEILMSRTQKLKGLSAAALRKKTLDDNPYFINPYILNNYGVFSRSYCDCCLAKS